MDVKSKTTISISQFFLLTLVIILNLKIPMKYKITLILLGVVLCFYQPKFIIPFLISIVVVYLSNKVNLVNLLIYLKTKHKKKNKSKKIIESFDDMDDINKLFENPQNLKESLDLKKYLRSRKFR